jgi:murein DD-endopeptidase MepM/ murein hydrolase activator NlpD
VRKVLIALLAGALVMIAAPVQAAPATPPPTPAPSADPLAGQLQAQLQEQAALKNTVSSLTGELQAARDSQQSLRGLVAANQRAITQTLGKLAVAEQQYSDATTREATDKADAAAARRRAAADKALLAIYLRLGYQTHDSLLSYVLSSASVSELLSRAADVSQLVHRSADLVTQINADISQADAAETQAAAEAVLAQQATTQLQLQEQALQQQTQHAGDLIAQLGTQAAATAHEIGAANGQSLAVAQSIAQTRLEQLDQTIAAAEQAAWQEAAYYLQNHLGTLPPGIGTPPTAPVNANGTQLIWAAHGVDITQPFGPSSYPFEPAFGGYPHFHTGIDLAGPRGTPILAAADGVVAIAEASTVGYGNHVIIAHANGMLTLYGHLEAMLVQPGQTVKAGQMIGLLGSTGNSTGPHCHFEVRINDLPVDPRPFLPLLAPGATGP